LGTPLALDIVVLLIASWYVHADAKTTGSLVIVSQKSIKKTVTDSVAFNVWISSDVFIQNYCSDVVKTNPSEFGEVTGWSLVAPFSLTIKPMI